MLLGVLLAAAPAQAEPITTPAFVGKCLEASNQGRPIEGGAALIVADCNGSPAQDFRFDQASSTLKLGGSAPALCLSLSGPPMNGEGVHMGVCLGQPGQTWAFPFDLRLRPVGVDPNKCLTHSTREGKPPTGWGFDFVVLDPGCEFPEVGGGGVCFPSFGLFRELSISSCDGRTAQQWRLEQAGMPFPPDGLVSRKTHVTVDNLHIDDCREAGSCDWKLTCGLGVQADRELIGMADMNTGGTIPVGQSLVHEGDFPATVTCEVREFDRGIFDPDVWEVVGTQSTTFTATGPSTLVLDNSEGKVTINFTVTQVGVIQQPVTIEGPPVPAVAIDGLTALRFAGFDFSVPEADLREWLSNPEFTPYPAVADALVRLLAGAQLQRPVFIDVVVFNYENTPGVASPRRGADVDPALLSRAIVEGHNIRYGERVTALRDLLR